MCYIIPVGGAVITSFVWKKKKTLKLWWLNLMFYGGALFGIIDHLWNRELFLISENWIMDLFLGVVISLGIILFWLITLVFAKRIPSLASSLEVSR